MGSERVTPLNRERSGPTAATTAAAAEVHLHKITRPNI